MDNHTEMSAEQHTAKLKVMFKDKEILDEATQKTRLKALELTDMDIRDRACDVLDQISDALMGTDIETTPRIWGSHVVSDGSFLIEWLATDARLGFSIEPDKKESSWYIVTRPEPDFVCDHGFLSESKVSDLVLRFLELVKDGEYGK